jgi:hypothetical protein
LVSFRLPFRSISGAVTVLESVVAALSLGRQPPTGPLVIPGAGQSQRPAGLHTWDLVIFPLGGDQHGHRYRPIASLTHYAEYRIMPRSVVNGLSGRGLVSVYSA